MIATHLVGMPALVINMAMRWPSLVPIVFVGVVVTTPQDLGEHPLHVQSAAIINQESPRAIVAAPDSMDSAKVALIPAVGLADPAIAITGTGTPIGSDFSNAEPRVRVQAIDPAPPVTAGRKAYLTAPVTAFGFNPVITTRIDDARRLVTTAPDASGNPYLATPATAFDFSPVINVNVDHTHRPVSPALNSKKAYSFELTPAPTILESNDGISYKQKV